MKTMRLFFGTLMVTLLLVCSVSFTSYAYTEEEKAQAKAWLSAHGYSPDWGGANQAYQDYLNGKFDEELGVDVNGDGIPATTQAGTESASSQDETESTTEEKTEESTQVSDEEDTEDDHAVLSKNTNVEGDNNTDAVECEEDATLEVTEQQDASGAEEKAADDVIAPQDVSKNAFHLEGYQVVMIVIVVLAAICLVFCLIKGKKTSQEN